MENINQTKTPVQQPAVTNVDVKPTSKYLAAWGLLIPIIIGFCLIFFTSLGAWKDAGITIVLLLGSGILIYHKYITEEFDKMRNAYLTEIHNAHTAIFEMETRLRDDLSKVINDMLTQANEHFTDILTKIHEDIHGKEEKVGELVNTIGEEVKTKEEGVVGDITKEATTTLTDANTVVTNAKEVVDNTVLQEVEPSKD